MSVHPHPQSSSTAPLPSAAPSAGPTRRSRMRLATVGGIAAIAILGGAVTAAASSGTAAGNAAVAAATGAATTPSLVTSQLEPTGAAAPAAPGTSGSPAAPGAAAPAAPGTSGSPAAPPAPPVPKVHQPHLDGTVTSVTGSTVLIKDREGFTRTIVTSSSTTYQDGLGAAPAVGTKIHAEGTVAADGTSLDATVIGADKGPAGAPGGRGPGGKGPGAPGDRRPAPGGADAPTPPAAGGTSGPAAPTGQTAAPAPSTMATTK